MCFHYHAYFSGEYQSGADSILRCAKHGRTRLAITKILASSMIVMVVYTMCITLHLAISDITFGTNCLQSSVQMLFSIINLPNWDLAQMQIVISLVGLISVLACVYCTFFISKMQRYIDGIVDCYWHSPYSDFCLHSIRGKLDFSYFSICGTWYAK